MLSALVFSSLKSVQINTKRGPPKLQRPDGIEKPNQMAPPDDQEPVAELQPDEAAKDGEQAAQIIKVSIKHVFRVWIEWLCMCLHI